MKVQLDFFNDAKRRRGRDLPEGLRYRPSLIGADEDKSLVARVSELPFREFEFHGYLGKRRVGWFRWKSCFSSPRLQKAEYLPDYLVYLRKLAGEFGGLDPDALEQVLVSE